MTAAERVIYFNHIRKVATAFMRIPKRKQRYAPRMALQFLLYFNAVSWSLFYSKTFSILAD